MKHYFYDTISQLRSSEEIFLYNKVIAFNDEDDQLVADFLAIEYENESLNYPFTAPEFDKQAALWAAKIVYTSCQLIIYRAHKSTEIEDFLPDYTGELNASSILSADLCLRFLPQIFDESKRIDFQDAILPIIDNMLAKWHYSSIGSVNEYSDLNFIAIFDNPCLTQLYIDRVINRKDINRASLSELNNKIKSVMGNYSEQFWKEFTLK